MYASEEEDRCIVMCRFAKSFSKDGTEVLTLKIEYPKVDFPDFRRAESIVNRCIRAQIDRFYHYASTVLYRQAVFAYQNQQADGAPFHPYDAVMKYEVTCAKNCFFSVYRDCYEFTGGAHGNTVRRSDTWNLATGKNVPLGCFFRPGVNYRRTLFEEVLRQAKENMEKCPDLYFEDYQELIRRYFSLCHYYLTPDGPVIYYQLYEIAPYAAGFVTFSIPKDLLDCPPKCPG